MINKATHEGELEIGKKKLNCAVLQDGTRVLTLTAVFQAFDRPVRSKINAGNRADQMPSFLDAKNLQPYVNEELMDVINPVEYRGKNGGLYKGYDAQLLPMVADVYLKARRDGALNKKQIPQAIASEILLSGLARVGIIALVDEATGYQYDREKDELQKILRAYISEELLVWQKRFPDIYYKELFRLNGWDFTVKGIKRRPGVIGKWTNTLIYEQLPKGVLDELKSKTPKNDKGQYTAKFHQSLTTDIGHPHLTQQINQIITLFQLSDNMKHMWSQFKKLKARQSGQLEIPFDFDNKGHTKEPVYEEKQLSSFNKNLKIALEYNPREESRE